MQLYPIFRLSHFLRTTRLSTVPPSGILVPYMGSAVDFRRAADELYAAHSIHAPGVDTLFMNNVVTALAEYAEQLDVSALNSVIVEHLHSDYIVFRNNAAAGSEQMLRIDTVALRRELAFEEDMLR